MIPATARSFRLFAGALAATLFATACGDVPTQPPLDAPVAEAAVAGTTNVNVPFQFVTLVPCAADGAGEVILLEGVLHTLTHFTVNDAGTAVYKSHFQPQRLQGYGLVTGDRYQGTGATQTISVEHVGGFPFTSSSNNNFRFLGQGRGNNFLVHVVQHITVNAQGNVTAEVAYSRVTCG